MNLIINGIIIAFLIVLTNIRTYLFFKTTTKSSKNLHTKMFNCLLLAPMKFFNKNTSGTILNRFSKDIGGMDDSFPKKLLNCTQVSIEELKFVYL